jgi:hypothetical protein
MGQFAGKFVLFLLNDDQKLVYKDLKDYAK